MAKNVQIPLELFYDLVKAHLLDLGDEDTLERIRKALEGKLDAMAKHELYSTSKTADSPREREKARLEYLDKVGIHKDFRW